VNALGCGVWGSGSGVREPALPRPGHARRFPSVPRFLSWCLGVLVASSGVAFAGEAEAPVKKTVSGIHVWTDRSVDCFTRDTIIRSLIKPEMTDEQKAVALWRFVNRRIWHSPRPDDNDPQRVLCVYGYALCGTIRETLVWLGQGVFGKEGAGDSGVSSREIDDPAVFNIAGGGWLVDSLFRLDGGKAPGRMGHSWAQFRYGGRLHYLDAHATFYVYTADGKQIASLEEIGGDPTLVTDPVRTSEPFMPCDGGRPEFFYRAAGGGLGTGERKTAHSMALTVRPGEALVFHFDKLPGGYFKRSESWKGQWDPEFTKNGPAHNCNSGAEASWRHYGNGEILYKPDFSKGGFREALAASDNLAAQADDGKPGLHPREAGKPAAAAFSFGTPYVMVGGEVSAEFDLPKDARAKLLLVVGGKALAVAEAAGAGGKQKVSGKLDLQAAGYPYAAQVRVELSGGAADAPPALLALDVRIVTQLNFLTLPRPLPGKNLVSFECTGGDPEAAGLRISWHWIGKGGAQAVDNFPIPPRRQFAYSMEIGPVETQPEENPKYMRWLRLEMPDK